MKWNRIKNILLITIVGLLLIGLIFGEENEDSPPHLKETPPQEEVKIVAEPVAKPPPKPKEKLFASKGGASVHCKDLVKRKLISPATAKFSWSIVIDAFPAEDHTLYHVLSYVDSQNKFGAMLRTHFKCKLKATGNDFEGWELIDLQLE